MADQDDSATAILRRLAAEIRELRIDLKDLSKHVVEIKVAVATKPSRAELWAVMGVMMAVFALSFAGLAVVLPMLGKL